MARFNTALTSASITGTATIGSPNAGSFTNLTGTAPYTVTVPNPQLHPGVNQVFYNATSGTVTLTTPSGNFNGTGGNGTASISVFAGNVVSITSDGTHYIVISEDGSALTATTGSFSGNVTMNGSGATVSITPSTLTVAPTGASTIDAVAIGSTTRAAGAFTSLAANAAVTLTANTASSSTGTGTLVVTGGIGASGQVTATAVSATNLTGTLQTAAQPNITSVGALTSLTINSGGGAGGIAIGSDAGRALYQYVNFGGGNGGVDYAWQIGRSPNGGVGPADGFYFYDIKANATRVSINGSGNVGIGTANPSWPLTVKSGSSGTVATFLYDGAFAGTSEANIGLRWYNGGNANDIPQVKLRGYGTSNYTGNFGIDVLVGGTYPNGFAERFTIQGTTGNVGIGATNPTFNLDVQGGDMGIRAFGTVRAKVNLQTTNRAGWQIEVNDAASGGNQPGGSLGFTEAGVAGGRLVLAAGGNVGIGTTNPSTKLDVNGALTVNGRQYFNGSASFYSLGSFNGGSSQWVLLGRFTGGTTGETLNLHFYGANGYNGTYDQHSRTFIQIRNGNGNPVDTNVSVDYHTEGQSTMVLDVRVQNVNGIAYGTTWDVYVQINGVCGNAYYIPFINSGASWSHTGTAGVSAPTVGPTVISGTNLFMMNSTSYFHNSVGIGTTNPNARLSLIDENGGQSMLQVRNYNTSATGAFSNAYTAEIRGASSGTQMHGTLIHLHENNNDRRTLDVSDYNGIIASFVNGKVGIGTTLPTGKLHISLQNSDSATTGINVISTASVYPGTQNFIAGKFINNHFGDTWGLWVEANQGSYGACTGIYAKGSIVGATASGVHGYCEHSNPGGYGVAIGGQFVAHGNLAGGATNGTMIGVLAKCTSIATSVVGNASYGIRLETNPGPVSSYGGVYIHNGSQMFVLNSNGGISNYSGNNLNLSDQREKRNIVLAGDYLSKICAIPIKTFNYNNDAEGEQVTLGVIAQEVEPIAPELVSESEWEYGSETNADGAPISLKRTRKGIYETDMMFAIMKSVQELNAKHEALKLEFDAYKTAHP